MQAFAGGRIQSSGSFAGFGRMDQKRGSLPGNFDLALPTKIINLKKTEDITLNRAENAYKLWHADENESPLQVNF